MASGDRTFLADKETLDSVKSAIGTSQDTGSDTLFGVMKQSSPHKYANSTSGKLISSKEVTITGSGVVSVCANTSSSSEGVGILYITIDNGTTVFLHSNGGSYSPSLTNVYFFSESIKLMTGSNSICYYTAQFD